MHRLSFTTTGQLVDWFTEQKSGYVCVWEERDAFSLSDGRPHLTTSRLLFLAQVACMQSSTLQPSPGVAYFRVMTIIFVLCDYGLISPGARAVGTFRETKLSFRLSMAVTPAHLVFINKSPLIPHCSKTWYLVMRYM